MSDFGQETRKSKGAVPKGGFDDPAALYPTREYTDVATTNKAARGLVINKVNTGGGYKNLSLDLKDLQPSVYPNNQVNQTASGHITEYDDTPGSERILIRHRTGSGVELRADGTVIYSSTCNTIRVTACDEKVIVDGDGELVYNGNLTLQVAGDFDLVVGGNYNVTVGGNKNEETRGSHKHQVRKTQKTIVTEHQSNFVGGTQTETILGSANKIIKGDTVQTVEGGFELYSGDEFMVTAERMMSFSSTNINIGASSLTVIGDSGTIGGANIVGYGNSYWAGTFHGTLNGKADEAAMADVASGAYIAGGLGGPGSPSYPSHDTHATVNPSSEIMFDYLNNSNFGIRDINIDPGNQLKNSFDKTEEYGGISNRELTISEVRSKLRDKNTLSNKTFIGAMISEGKLNPGYIQAAPSKIGRSVPYEPTPRRGTSGFGNRSNPNKRFIA